MRGGGKKQDEAQQAIENHFIAEDKTRFNI